MLYKQAWKELKIWAIEKQTLVFRRKMNELEKRWKISPPKSRAGRVKRRIEV